MANIFTKLYFGKDTKSGKVEISSYLERALNEVELNIVDRGLWAKALSVAEFDDQKAKGKYLELRSEELWESVNNFSMHAKWIAAGADKMQITDYPFKFGDWTGIVDGLGRTHGLGEIKDYYGNRSKNKETYNFWASILLPENGYKLPANHMR